MNCFHKQADVMLTLAELGAEGNRESIAANTPPIDLVYSAPPNREFYYHWTSEVPYGKAADDFIQLMFDIDAPTMVFDLYSLEERVLAEFETEWPYCQTRPIVYEAPTTKNGKGRAVKPGAKQVILSRSPLKFGPILGLGSRAGLTEIVATVLPSKSTMFDPFVGRGLSMQVAVTHGHRFYGVDADPDRLASCVGWLNDRKRN